MLRQRLVSLLSLLFLFVCLKVFSQDAGHYILDSLKKRLAEARTPAEKANYLMGLSRVTVDLSTAEDYANRGIEAAQLSRDRRLIAQVYLMNGRRFMSNASLTENLIKADENFHQSEQLARDNEMDDLLVYSYCGMSQVWQYRGKKEKALSYSNEALSVAMTTDNDSARERAYVTMGEVYQGMNEMLLALRNYLSARDVAERSGKDDLLRDSYAHLDQFYEGIHEYDRAIDFRMKAFDLDRKIWSFEMTSDEYRIGDLFLKNNQPALAMEMYEKSIRLADSVHFPLLKFNSYFRIFSMYFHDKEYAKGLSYLKSHQSLVDILSGFGFQFYIRQIYGMAYGEQGKFDSALYFFRLAEPDVEKKGIPEAQFDFYEAFGNYYANRNDDPSAIACYNKAFAKAAAAGQLEWEAESSDSLKGLYEKTGDYQSALIYTLRSAGEQDSLRTQTRATDLMKLEVENDNRRRERLAHEEELRTEHRHNVQYMGFTIGLVSLFIVLVMMGRLSVSLSLIRALGFLSFIFLFEFIILLADKPIQALTGDEPWKILLIKIGLGAGLVPLHHWLEHKVIHHLSSRKRIAVPVAKK